MKPKKSSLVAPLILETEDLLASERNTIENNPLRSSITSPSSSKKRMPSQAYKQSARNSKRQVIELNQINNQKNSLDPLNSSQIPNSKKELSFNSLLFTEKLNKIGWKTIICSVFLISFSFGILIGTLVSIEKLPKQGFYLFLVIGLIVLFPAIYAAYQIIGKLFGW